jgi:hypothetical protein
MHFKEALHNPIALLLGHIVVNRQAKDAVGSRFRERQRRAMTGPVRSHMMAWRAIIFSKEKIFLFQCSGHGVAIESKLTVINYNREVPPDRVLVEGCCCHRQTRTIFEAFSHPGNCSATHSGRALKRLQLLDSDNRGDFGHFAIKPGLFAVAAGSLAKVPDRQCPSEKFSVTCAQTAPFHRRKRLSGMKAKYLRVAEAAHQTAI